MAALAAKYWAVTEAARPSTAISTSSSPHRMTTGWACRRSPSSTSLAMISGTVSSNSASSSLKAGPRTHSFR